MSGGLLALMLGVRLVVPPVSSAVTSTWYANAVASLPEEERAKTLSNPRKMLRPRSLQAPVVQVW